MKKDPKQTYVQEANASLKIFYIPRWILKYRGERRWGHAELGEAEEG